MFGHQGTIVKLILREAKISFSFKSNVPFQHLKPFRAIFGSTLTFFEIQFIFQNSFDAMRYLMLGLKQKQAFIFSTVKRGN